MIQCLLLKISYESHINDIFHKAVLMSYAFFPVAFISNKTFSELLNSHTTNLDSSVLYLP